MKKCTENSHCRRLVCKLALFFLEIYKLRSTEVNQIIWVNRRCTIRGISEKMDVSFDSIHATCIIMEKLQHKKLSTYSECHTIRHSIKEAMATHWIALVVSFPTSC
ncbi:hypothetical protein NPIL_447861 [Nephila pilipes]|uniref:Uncharacterized protein n=1 Tax=Nephila pilipes TaxID=299642 RepID=A0A8X6TDK4_NEPPI|nr:hypothetical protein NPIL_447861 [Nephila pilipes]